MAKKELNAVFESGPMGVVASNVDKANHIVKHVKILGKTSKNGRDYSGVINGKTATAYENAKVYVGHPDKPGQSRNGKYGERIARVRNAVAEADGIYGDLHLNPEHPLTKSFMWEAENDPTSAGLSHHADLVYRDRNQSAVESIENVKSVDIVDSPATTNGIFESENPVKTLKQVLESLPADHKARAVFEEVMAGDAGMAAVSVDTPAGAKDDDQIAAAFKSMLTSVIDDESLDDSGKLKKMKDILSAKAKLTGKPAEKKDPPADDAKSEAKTESVEELRNRINRVERENEARKLAGKEGIVLEDIDIKAVCALESVEDRTAFIKRLPKPVVESKGSPPPKPAKSGSAATFESVEEPQTFKSNEDRLAFLRG